MIGKVYAFHSRGVFNYARQNLYAERCVFKLARDSVSAAEQIERGFCPVVGGADLCPRLAAVFIRRCHSQEMSQSNVINRFFAALYLIIGKEIKHLLFSVLYISLIDSYSYQQRHYAFRNGHHVHRVGRPVPVPAFVKYGSTVSYCVYLTDVAFVARAFGNISM